jgi:hypothetical protein
MLASPEDNNQDHNHTGVPVVYALGHLLEHHYEHWLCYLGIDDHPFYTNPQLEDI